MRDTLLSFIFRFSSSKMIASNLNEKLPNESCEYSIKCTNSGIHHCQGCGQLYCTEHHIEHRHDLQEHFEYITHIQQLLKQNLKTILSQLPAEQARQLKTKSNEIEQTATTIQKRLEHLINTDNQNCKQFDPDQNDYLENNIEQLRKDIEEFAAQLEEIDEDDDTNDNDPMQTSQHVNETGERKGVIGSNTTSRITRKIRLAHNYIRFIRGPAKKMVNGVTHVTEAYTQRKDIDESILQAVRQGLTKQKTNQSHNSTFAEITSDWKYEGENVDRGFISASLWMRDPQGRRILAKIQGHPLSAVNEWLAYVIGESLDLPVNRIQIGIYQNKLVTLHTDVAHENETTTTFMDLPKLTRKILLTYPIMGSMDLFDHVIQNVDRTARNILITMPETSALASDPSYMKIHFIDHSFCFGVGKREVISAIACKLHSKHLSVVKFDPINAGRKFEQYLTKLPILDRITIRKTLINFAAITDDQLSNWMNKVQDLLSNGQFNRIYDVLVRQRDIAKYYTIQWGMGPISSSIKSNERN